MSSPAARSTFKVDEHLDAYFEPVGSLTRVNAFQNANGSQLKGKQTHICSPKAQRICQICLEQRATHAITALSEVPRICRGCHQRSVVGASDDDSQSDNSNESAACFHGLDVKHSFMRATRCIVQFVRTAYASQCHCPFLRASTTVLKISFIFSCYKWAFARLHGG